MIGLGANMPHPDHGEPVKTLAAAVRRLASSVNLVGQSSWYRTAPVPLSDQPWFANAVVHIETELPAPDLLNLLHDIEAEFGRVRREKWAARLIDLDLLAYHDQVTENTDQISGPVVPHPLLETRAFVLAPIAEIAPDWRHPVSGKTAPELLKELPDGQVFDIIRAGDVPT
nr:2-amino-4-hydroxy-6-hydroxymethyldihydropteridine diphosphokinase [Sneathiella chungangensis]